MLPLPPKVKEVMFSPLSVCLCAGYLKKLGTDPDEFCGQVQCVTRTNRFDFGEDPDPDSSYENFKSDSSPLRDYAKPIYRMISQKVVDGFGQNLVDRLGAWQGRIRFW